jgi:hypothetical protein
MFKNKKIFIFLLCVLILVPVFVFAQGTAKLTNPLGTSDVPAFIGRIIKAVLGIVGSLALLMFVYGGFLWMTSGGNEQKITKGKNVLVWATIGLAIIFLSYSLVGFVIKGLTGGEQPQTDIGTCICGADKSYGATKAECAARVSNVECYWTVGTGQ